MSDNAFIFYDLGKIEQDASNAAIDVEQGQGLDFLVGYAQTLDQATHDVGGNVGVTDQMSTKIFFIDHNEM